MSTVMILKNLRGTRDGAKTGAVGVSFAFWQALIEESVYTLSLPGEDKHQGPGYSYQMNHITNADIDLMILLHKICNTNGFIREVSFHQITQAAHLYFEKPTSTTQLYTSMQKFLQLGLVHKQESDIYPVASYQLQYFQDENGKLHRYVPLTPFVFKEEFATLSLAARKLYLLTAMQQGNNDFIFRKLHGDNGLLAFLRKNQARHIYDVLRELDPHLSVQSMTKERGAYRMVYIGLKSEHRIARTNDKIREPLEPPRRYPRKARFIEKVLHECGIGELSSRVHTMVQMLKHMGYRVIRQVIKTIRRFYDSYGTFPKDLALFIKKEVRFSQQKNILDLADKHGLMEYITWRNTETDDETRYFEFANTLSHFNHRQLKQIFRTAADQIGKLLPDIHQTKDAYYTVKQADHLHGIDHYRAMAHHLKLDADWYTTMEHKAVHKAAETGEEEAMLWFGNHLRQQLHSHRESFPFEWRVEDFILAHSPLVY